MDHTSEATASEIGGRRRRLRTGLLLAAVVLVIAVAAAASVGFGQHAAPEEAAVPQTAVTAPVERETLVSYITMDGQIGYGDGWPVSSKSTGTVTWLPAVGSTVSRGQPLLMVDDQPVVLLIGVLPMYRQLAVGTRGRDVRQFETNLRALGYSGFTVDEEFSTYTSAAVKHWQHDCGLPETGTVPLGQVIYAPGPLRIAQQLVRVGAASPADVLTVTGTTKVVTALTPAADAGWAAPDATVAVTLPEGGTVPGRVTALHEDASGGSGTSGGASDAASSNVRLTISIANEAALKGLDRGAVIVRYAAKVKKNVLTVPVEALLALAEGGYGLEIVDGATTRIVAVQVGMFANGRVEVSGSGIQAGVLIRMPG